MYNNDIVEKVLKCPTCNKINAKKIPVNISATFILCAWYYINQFSITTCLHCVTFVSSHRNGDKLRCMALSHVVRAAKGPLHSISSRWWHHHVLTCYLIHLSLPLPANLQQHPRSRQSSHTARLQNEKENLIKTIFTHKALQEYTGNDSILIANVL